MRGNGLAFWPLKPFDDLIFLKKSLCHTATWKLGSVDRSSESRYINDYNSPQRIIFSLRDVTAEVGARSDGRQRAPMKFFFETFCLDVERRELSDGSKAVPIARKAFAVLLYLVENRDRMVPKDELLNAFWPPSISEGVLQTTIRQVRRTLGDDGRAHMSRARVPLCFPGFGRCSCRAAGRGT